MASDNGSGSAVTELEGPGFDQDGPPPPAPPPRRPVAPRSLSFPRVLISGALIGSAVAGSREQANLSPADPFLVLIMLLGVWRMLHERVYARRVLVACLPWIWLLLAASFLSLFNVGLSIGALDGVLRDMYVLAMFFSVLAMAERDGRSIHLQLVPLFLFLFLTVLMVFVQSDRRNSGTFDNANYAGHFLVAVTLYLFTTGRNMLVRLLPVAVVPFALLGAGSFGSILMLVAGVGYAVWLACRASRNVFFRAGAAAALVVIVAVAGGFVNRLQNQQDYQVASAVSNRRFVGSQSNRLEMWTQVPEIVRDRPMGLGAKGIRSLETLNRGRIHNDYLRFVVEFGILGLIALLVLGWVLWRNAPPGGSARVLLVGIAANAFFHDTFHFRHMWILLALAFAYDLNRSRRRRVPPARLPVPTAAVA